MAGTPQQALLEAVRDLVEARARIQAVAAIIAAATRAEGQHGAIHNWQREMGALADALKQAEDLLLGEHTQISQLSALAQMAAELLNSLDFGETLARALDLVCALVSAERGFLFLEDAGSGALSVMAQGEPLRDLPDPEALHALAISRSILREVLASGASILADNAYKDPRFLEQASVVNFGLRSVICTPLTYRGERLGAVYVDNRLRAGIFSERERELVAAFADVAAVALANAYLYDEQAELLRETDTLRQNLADVFRDLPSGVVRVDAHGRVRSWNPAAASLLGRPAGEVLGQPLDEVLPALSAAIAALVQQAQIADAPRQITLEHTGPAGARQALQVAASPMPAGDAGGTVLVIEDVTATVLREATIDSIRRFLPAGLADEVQQYADLVQGGARREITCLFAALGDDPTYETTPAEQMAAATARISRASGIIHASGGIIDKIMGHEIMALWNSPLNPCADHAARALAAALALADRPGWAGSAGLHSGDATLGNVGSATRREFTAVGDTVNLARRLQQGARPGQILASAAAIAGAREHPNDAVAALVIGDGALVEVRGRSAPIVVHEVRHA
jgi:adenylate cyclase